jgi:hypothetical protein
MIMLHERAGASGSDTDEVPCVRCGEPKDLMELDRLLWCRKCQAEARNRASWWGWLIGLVFAGCIAAYIWLFIRPSNLIIGGWIATVVVALWLGSKIGRELVYGIARARKTGLHDGAPPASTES